MEICFFVCVFSWVEEGGGRRRGEMRRQNLFGDLKKSLSVRLKAVLSSSRQRSNASMKDDGMYESSRGISNATTCPFPTPEDLFLEVMSVDGEEGTETTAWTPMVTRRDSYSDFAEYFDNSRSFKSIRFGSLDRLKGRYILPFSTYTVQTSSKSFKQPKTPRSFC